MKFSIVILSASIVFCSCKKTDVTESKINYRQTMVDFVISISKYSKKRNPNFIIIPQNGIELVSTNNSSEGPPNMGYLNAIDANGQEDLFYGYDADDQSTPPDVKNNLISFLNISKKYGKKILVTDYCSTSSKINNSYYENGILGYSSFAASQRELSSIPGYP